MREKMQMIKRLIDEEIDQRLQNDNPLIEALYKSAAYSAAGGKRIRAVFVFYTGELFDVPQEKLINAACSIELIHAASLIMDDLPYMDDSQLRRGKPANHVVFGQDVALLASIGLISEGIQMILSDAHLTEDERLKAAQVLSASFGFNGLAAGQFVDLKIKDKNVNFEIIEFINQKKTAALFSAAGKVAAIIGHANEDQAAAIQKFSEDIGFAFQIVDDMLDVIGEEKLVGKNIGQDRMNFVKLVGMEQARKYLAEYHQKAVKSLEIFGDKAAGLKELSDYLIQRVR
ncbi:polyprenyl synthetase family protein [Caldithrix abyssi]|uniref:Geranylgeranyl diphosphate synthase, type II n=1 Tax=Caldithrix abyssi DSM 13497 TaxID=880073 RepID=H1XXE7_CALAY|nr:polyprenyl synthetase family protein [Caldithrix abyssi]APF17865.1 geranylgeranyl diphosphate synthase, type II [Caldithrix abyssi DSM 13497]EHO41932.1 Polyprenyl synthetase [Caldithrix abyssi DSM 13497]